MVSSLAATGTVSALFSPFNGRSGTSIADLIGAPVGGGSDAAVVNLSDNSFRARLEKHLDDVKRGRGNLTASVDSEVFSRDTGAASYLSSNNPKAATLYQQYQTGLTYSQRARFVAGVSQTTRSLAFIK